MMSPELQIDRVFPAPPALVFAHWQEPELLGAWLAPRGTQTMECGAEGPAGGWRLVYRQPSPVPEVSGVRSSVRVRHGRLRELSPPHRLRLSLFDDVGFGHPPHQTEVEVRFSEVDGDTAMHFLAGGVGSPDLRDALAAEWASCFERLEEQIRSEQEIRTLHEEWFRASERKDLEASIFPIAADVLSYEHEAPLVFRGASSVRASCELGFANTPPGLRWEVPDLRVIIRGDLAITWGLNHMHGGNVDLWSRGTRLFQRRDGRWQMIHQHVSFPFDPATGAAKMDLGPEG